MRETQTVARALDILFAIAQANSPLSVSDIAKNVSIPESTTYRMLQTLEQNGVVERREKGKIGLGLRILELVRCLSQHNDKDLYVVAKPVMEDLTEETGETSILTVKTGLNTVYVQSVESKHAIRFFVECGKTSPLYSGASSKSILAFEKSWVIEQVLGSISSEKREALTAELANIRQQGYCITVGDVEKDGMGIGVPVYDIYGRVMASLIIAGPASRMKQSNIHALTQAVIVASKKISDNLTGF